MARKKWRLRINSCLYAHTILHRCSFLFNGEASRQVRTKARARARSRAKEDRAKARSTSAMVLEYIVNINQV